MIFETNDLPGIQTFLLGLIASWCVFDVVRYMILRKFK